MLKPQCCYGVAEVLDLLVFGSAVGSFVPKDLLLQKICLKWAELGKLWWGGSERAAVKSAAKVVGEFRHQPVPLSCRSKPLRFGFAGFFRSWIWIWRADRWRGWDCFWFLQCKNFNLLLWSGHFQTYPFRSARADWNQKTLLLPKIKALIYENKISKFSKF